MTKKTLELAFLFILLCAMPACVAVDSTRTDIALIKARVGTVEFMSAPPPAQGNRVNLFAFFNK